MIEQKTDGRFPCWRIRSYLKFNDNWQPSYFGWHWMQDMVYVFEKSEEAVIEEVMDKVERYLSRLDDYQAQTIEIRYCVNKEELNQ